MLKFAFRAQALDALSLMANISGYRAVIEAAHEFAAFLQGKLQLQVKYPGKSTCYWCRGWCLQQSVQLIV